MITECILTNDPRAGFDLDGFHATLHEFALFVSDVVEHGGSLDGIGNGRLLGWRLGGREFLQVDLLVGIVLTWHIMARLFELFDGFRLFLGYVHSDGTESIYRQEGRGVDTKLVVAVRRDSGCTGSGSPTTGSVRMQAGTAIVSFDAVNKDAWRRRHALLRLEVEMLAAIVVARVTAGLL